MMNKTLIEWCDFTFNPITGCRHGCQYCYARRQAQRFCGDIRLNKTSEQLQQTEDGLWILEEPFRNNQGKVIPLPVGFEPLLHRYRLPMPAQKKKPANIFVCSMADLFGEWGPDEWIKEIFAALGEAPWHNYLFLTKNPKRYSKLAASGDLPPEHWYGFTLTGTEEAPEQLYSNWRTFVSIEPLLAMPDLGFLKRDNMGWVIIGAQTGPGAKQHRPQREWIQRIVDECKKEGVPLFMKDSVLEIWEDPLIREYPAELQPKEVIIPHCDKCEHTRATPQGKRGTRYDCDLTGKHIPGRYSRTSPPWCPKREEAGKP
jgi:protein gp37